MYPPPETVDQVVKLVENAMPGEPCSAPSAKVALRMPPPEMRSALRGFLRAKLAKHLTRVFTREINAQSQGLVFLAQHFVQLYRPLWHN